MTDASPSTSIPLGGPNPDVDPSVAGVDDVAKALNVDPDTGLSSIEVGAGADANGDGTVDLMDVLMLRRYLVNIDPATGESTIVLGP